MAGNGSGQVYSATYSNVPVYEFNVDGSHVMRRRGDDWINATHILKVVGFDKPARTRILEREVQKGTHEKIQGGYGKYQGTWIPLQEGRALAHKNHILNKLLPLFDFVPGDTSPPPAPKHSTAAANRPKAPRGHANKRAHPPAPRASYVMDSPYVDTSAYHVPSETPDNVTLASESMIDEEDQEVRLPPPKKRKHFADGPSAQSIADQEHQQWSDDLLDYFMLLNSPDAIDSYPVPPPSVNLDRPVDASCHTALHWASAMGDLRVMRDLVENGARIDCLNLKMETPLMRAVLFTNCFDRQCMHAVAHYLISTVQAQDIMGFTVFHHMASITSSRSRYKVARYYQETILNRLSETCTPRDITTLLNVQDNNGDTAMMIAARNGARKLVRGLLGRHASVDIPNRDGETADHLIRALNARRRERIARQESSSPFNMGNGDGMPTVALAVTAPLNSDGPRAQESSASFAARQLSEGFHPLLQSGMFKLTGAYETEIREKDEELRESEQIVARKEQELTITLSAIHDTALQFKSEEEETKMEEQEEEELTRLEQELMATLEGKQKAELEALIKSVETQVDGTASAENKNEEERMREQLTLACKLAKAQEERREMVGDIVKAHGEAGMGNNIDVYKKVVTKALGKDDMETEDIEPLLSDILVDIEDGDR